MSPDGQRPVVVGVDPGHPGRMVLAWAADEANRRHLPVHVVQAWKPVTREVIWPRLWPELHDRAQLLRSTPGSPAHVTPRDPLTCSS